ncbi:MAG: aminopeptidase [Thermodesulfobacteriota bacterium]
MDKVLENIFTVNLGVRTDETVLVFNDIIAEGEEVSESGARKRAELREIAGAAAEAGKRHCKVAYLEFPSVMGHGKEPPVKAWEAAFGSVAVKGLFELDILSAILSKTAAPEDIKRAEAVIKERATVPGAVVAMSNYSTTHTRFRDFLSRSMGVRYASMPLFEKSMLSGAMAVDWEALKKRTLNLKEKLAGSDMVAVTSHNGTSITFSVKDRDILADTGVLTGPGDYGNLPAGEAFIAPVEGTAEGTLILEWAPTRRLKKPVAIEIRKGFAEEVSGDDEYADELREELKKNRLSGNVAELGIGTNEKASRPDNILETEKILGTVHIALGDNSSFGGLTSVPFHQDFIFFRPTLEVFKGGERVEILVEGEPRF